MELNFKFITYAYLLILLAGTVIPLNTGTALNDNYTMYIRWDYLLHAIVYLPLPVLLGLSLKRGSSGRDEQNIIEPGKKQQQVRGHKARDHRFWLQVVLVSLLVTVLLEGLQLIIPYRAFNINDMVANGVGTALGFVVALALQSTRVVGAK